MLSYINIILLFISLCIIYDFTYQRISVKNQVIIMLITLLMFIYARRLNEPFSTKYLKELDINHEQTKEFCKQLGLLDKPSEDTLLIKSFRDRSVERNNKKIQELKSEIDKYYVDKINKEVNLKNKFKLDQHRNALKQMSAIQKAKYNLINKNSVQINLE